MPHSLFELDQVLRGDADFTSLADELEAEKLDAISLGDATLLPVYDQLQFPRQKPFNRSKHAASTAVRLDVDLKVIGVACEAMSPALEFFVQLIEQDVAQKRRERTTLRRSLPSGSASA